MRRAFVFLIPLTACHHHRPAPTPLALQRVILYQNGIGYFERAGKVASDTVHFDFATHEVDDVLKTLTVIDKLGGGVATVDVPEVGPKERRVPVGVRLSQGKRHDVVVSYAIPTPTWKAAYRVVLSDDGDKPALLQGWAMINNDSQEDWKNVALTLATGAPLSYALDLHSAQYALRPDVTGKLVAPVVLGPIDAEKVTAAAAGGDRDHDGIKDADDLCPDQPEDKDGFEDEDGCPDPDNDHDRIPDVKDKCPNEPETYNGYEDDDGCPDRGRVVVTDTSIEILDMIYFETGKDTIRPNSFPIVDAVAATLQGNPTVKKLEVQGHAAATESDAWGLSTRRAAAVRAYLMEHGVAGARLTLQPYGASQPIDRGTTEQAYAKNRRVAFLITKRDDGDDDAPMARAVITPATATTGIETKTKPVEVAGSVRYELGEKVTIKHGGTTAISIVNKPIVAEDAFLYRPDANAPGSEKYPFRAVRLENGSGFTLQPGPIAIFARGTFVGDSLLAQLGLDETAWIPYALDSSTTVTPTTRSAEKGVRIVSIRKGVVAVENAGVRTTTYAVGVGRQPPKRLFVRHAKAAGYAIAAGGLPPGAMDQGDAWLVPLPLVAGKASELVIEEKEPRRRSIGIAEANAQELAVYVDGTANLPPAVAAALKSAIALRTEVAGLEAEVATLRDRYTDVAQRAQEIRASITALASVKNAEDLKKKLVASLAASTVESDGLTKQLAVKTEALTAARSRLADAIRDLSLDETKP